MNLRRLSLAILVGMNLTAGAANAASPESAVETESTSDNGGSVLGAALRAATHLASPDITQRVKAIDVLSACDATMHPICRVDMGMAYGYLAQDARLGSEVRAEYSGYARDRLIQAASLGNLEASKMITTLQNMQPNVVQVASTSDSVQPGKFAKPDRLKFKLVSSAGHAVQLPVFEGLEDSPIDRHIGFAPRVVSIAPMLLPLEPHGSATGPQPAATAHATAELDSIKEQLVSARLELQEANRTIETLRSLLNAQQAPAFNAAAANRKALDAALSGDYETAIPLFRKAAEANHPGAINNLAMMFVNATGVPRDLQQAISLFERAARLGNMESAENAARIYNYGIGRPKDPSRARTWYTRAIELGSDRARAEMAEMERSLEISSVY